MTIAGSDALVCKQICVDWSECTMLLLSFDKISACRGNPGSKKACLGLYYSKVTFYFEHPFCSIYPVFLLSTGSAALQTLIESIGYRVSE